MDENITSEAMFFIIEIYCFLYLKPEVMAFKLTN